MHGTPCQHRPKRMTSKQVDHAKCRNDHSSISFVPTSLALAASGRTEEAGTVAIAGRRGQSPQRTVVICPFHLAHQAAHQPLASCSGFLCLHSSFFTHTSPPPPSLRGGSPALPPLWHTHWVICIMSSICWCQHSDAQQTQVFSHFLAG